MYRDMGGGVDSRGGSQMQVYMGTHKLGKTDRLAWWKKSEERWKRTKKKKKEKKRRGNESYVLHSLHLLILPPPSVFLILHTHMCRHPHTDREECRTNWRPCKRALVAVKSVIPNQEPEQMAKAWCI